MRMLAIVAGSGCIYWAWKLCWLPLLCYIEFYIMIILLLFNMILRLTELYNLLSQKLSTSVHWARTFQLKPALGYLCFLVPFSRWYKCAISFLLAIWDLLYLSITACNLVFVNVPLFQWVFWKLWVAWWKMMKFCKCFA